MSLSDNQIHLMNFRFRPRLLPVAELERVGMIRNSRNLNFHEIFFDHDSSKRTRKAAGRRRIKFPRGN
jgi:hypothetical protein